MTGRGPYGKADVKAELEGLRGDMKKVLAELRTIKATQARQAKNQPRSRRKADTTVYDVNIGSSPIRGPAEAPVTITVFSDFQCPFSVKEYPKLQKVSAKYPNDVRMVFKHFPLSFHPKAKPAPSGTGWMHIWHALRIS